MKRTRVSKTSAGAVITIAKGDYEKASLDGEAWGHTQEIHSLMKNTTGIALFEVWEGVYLWNVIIYEGGQTETEEGKPIVLIVEPRNITNGG